LVVDDEVEMRAAVVRGLRAEGMDVVAAGDGPSALDAALTVTFDVIVLEIALPGLSGYQVLERLRAEGVDTPVVVISAKGSETDQAEGFNMGADSYLVKPFSPLVLLAQVRALLRRREAHLGEGPRRLRVGDLVLDPAARTATWRGRSVAFSLREYALLHALASQSSTVVSKTQLLRLVWGGEHAATPNAVEVYIAYLRRKFDEIGAPKVISTVHSHGYRLNPPGEPPAAGTAGRFSAEAV
jgi:DNA-binding response OmpR family regulator